MRRTQGGFTLIELSIVLVIIALVVGAVLVGHDLISAAALRAQISQIEKYNTAVNTFRGKYGALPGDMGARTALQFGFTARGSFAGEGDGNGLVEGVQSNSAANNFGYEESAGETVMFWVDLSTANGLNVSLIDGAFSTATPNNPGGGYSGTSLNQFFPGAKLGQGNYVYVYSNNGINYFGLSAITFLGLSPLSNPGLSAQQAYGIDKKIDDGYPQTGSVTAQYLNTIPAWAGASDTSATAGSAATCYDNGNSAGSIQQYSVGRSGGNGINCALSFQFQ